MSKRILKVLGSLKADATTKAKASRNSRKGFGQIDIERQLPSGTVVEET